MRSSSNCATDARVYLKPGTQRTSLKTWKVVVFEVVMKTGKSPMPVHGLTEAPEAAVYDSLHGRRFRRWWAYGWMNCGLPESMMMRIVSMSRGEEFCVSEVCSR